jgi:catechol 2,3-dioxygenase-like lactoylglutathione lyase family enzyme
MVNVFSKWPDGSGYQAGLFHIGVRVPDLEAAMAEIGPGLGITWAAVVERDQSLWTPQDGTRTVRLRFTYSGEGPQHVELLQGPPGSPWYGRDFPGIHHVGIWADDVAAHTERLVAQGWTLELAGKAPEEGYGAMTYVRAPSGLLVEPVDAAARPRMERWWAGGAFI